MKATYFGIMNVSGAELQNDKSIGFPGKLYEILEAPTTCGMKWSADGDAICIIPQRFNEYESTRHFQGTLYGSFTRRLYRYGFDRLVISPSSKADYPNGAHIYRNDLFCRGRPDLVKKIKVDNKRLYKKAIRQKKPESSPKEESEREKQRSKESVTTKKKNAPTRQEKSPVVTNFTNDPSSQGLWIQNQIITALRNIDGRLNLDRYLMATFSRSHNENFSGATDVHSNAIQHTTASASYTQSPVAGSLPGFHSSMNSSFLDSHILELLRLQHRR